ncbi:MAG: peptide-methionine (R)-S-oxide reductase, partial [Burkholderiales bacterium]|nr:peptide-methionine (R)-S-oxide reductase [Burkholderiales bacterium]
MSKIEKPDAQWKAELSPEAYQVLRHEGTERAGTSRLNDEKRPGTFVCAGCGTALFTSDMKFDSGT